jgi:hypothetical protein
MQNEDSHCAPVMPTTTLRLATANAMTLAALLTATAFCQATTNTAPVDIAANTKPTTTTTASRLGASG